MKFHLLPVGEKFEYQQEIYIKDGPLTANAEKTGNNRLIPRSANIQPLTDKASAIPAIIDEHQVKTSMVLNEFDRFYQHCIKCLTDSIPTSDTDMLKKKTTELEAARQQFIDSLIN